MERQSSEDLEQSPALVVAPVVVVVVVVVAVVVVVPKMGWRDPKGNLRVEDAAIYVHITYLYNSM